MPRSAIKRKIEACHEEGEESGEEINGVSTKEEIEPVKKRGRKSDSKVIRNENDEEVASAPLNLSKQRFVSEAERFEITVNDKTYTMEPKSMKSGSVGWQCSGKIDTTVDGKIFSTQSNFSATVIKSKEWKETEGSESEKNQDENQEEKKNENEEEKKDENEQEKANENEQEKANENEPEKENENNKDTNNEKNQNEVNANEETEIDKPAEMTRQDFLSKANNMTIGGFDKELVLKPKEFKTKNVGWHVSAKSERSFAGEKLKLQLNLTLTVTNSNKWTEA